MLSRVENRNDVNAVSRKEADLLREGYCSTDADEIPLHKEYRKFSYVDGRSVVYVIEWEDEVPVGSQIPVHAG